MIHTSERARLPYGLVVALVIFATLFAPVPPCLAETPETEPQAVPKASPAAVAARGGRDLIAAAEDAKVVVVGRFSNIEKIDLHGYAGDLRVDQAILGKAKVGDVLRVAWEELAASRPVRFNDGERVFLCLDSPPSYTLWQKRFPDNLRDILMVTRDGEAFLRAPSGKTLHLLEHYLMLGRGGRDDPAALGYLVEIVRAGDPVVAPQSLASLAGREKLAAGLSERSVAGLVSAATDENLDVKLRREILRLISRTPIVAARDGVEKLAMVGGPVRAEALLTLGKLDGGLPADVVAQLVADENGDLRAVAALYLQGEETTATLIEMATEDPSSAVRIAAVHRLIGEHGKEVFDEVAPALGDEDAAVRVVVAKELSNLGRPILPGLEKLANSGTQRQAEGVVLTLTMIGTDDAGKVLVELYHGHENKTVRGLAGVALGRMGGHEH